MTYPTKDSGFKPTLDEDSLHEVLSLYLNPTERLEVLERDFLNRYMAQCWIENDRDGFTGWRWEKYGVQLNIACAANRYRGIIVAGPRHYSNQMWMTIQALGGIDLLKEFAGEEYEQGFIDQYNTFHTRQEAWVIAEASGQIKFPDICPAGRLYSEHLI